MRHLEAALIGLVFAAAATYMAALSAKQSAPLYHVGAQRALAWALLHAQNATKATEAGKPGIVELVRLALSGTQSDVFVLNAGQPFTPSRPVCYAAVVFEPTGERVVVVCSGP